MHHYAALTIAIAGEFIGTSALKASDGFTKLLPTLLVFAGYGIAFYFLSITLKTLSVGLTYAIWSALGIILISVFGWIVYGQKMDAAGMIGMALIIAGVLVINLLSKTAMH